MTKLTQAIDQLVQKLVSEAKEHRRTVLHADSAYEAICESWIIECILDKVAKKLSKQGIEVIE